MAEARSKQLWTHTAAQLVVLANGLIKRKDGKPWREVDFNPFASAVARPAKHDVKLSPKESIAFLANLHSAKK